MGFWQWLLGILPALRSSPPPPADPLWAPTTTLLAKLIDEQKCAIGDLRNDLAATKGELHKAEEKIETQADAIRELKDQIAECQRECAGRDRTIRELTELVERRTKPEVG